MRRVLPSIFLVVALVIHFTPMLSFAEPVLIKDGFMTGNKFMELSSDEQSAYAMGLVDGMLLAPIFDAPKAKLIWLESCIVGMSNKQVAAMLRKELESKPGEWHYSAHHAMYRAMLEACPGSPKKTK
jgi:hypothetical protein